MWQRKVVTLGAYEEELENEWNVSLRTIYGSNLSEKSAMSTEYS